MHNRISENDNRCVGCENCVLVCNKHAITMKENSEGFLYPNVNSKKCINCGSCTLVCPMDSQQPLVNNVICSYAAVSQNLEIYKNAASGGIFGELATEFLKKNDDSTVFGAGFVNGMVTHIGIRDCKDVKLLQNSKYVQSRINSIFRMIKKELEENRNVLFSGTPCQVNALKVFLNHNYRNLFTVDIICHGVPSPRFLSKDLTLYGKREVTDIRFRLKNRRKNTHSGFVLSVFHGSNIDRVISSRDPYFNLFMKGDIYRESCYICPFSSTHRVGDITLGDCDSHNNYPDFHQNESLNTVLINSNKGQDLWNMIKSKIDFCELDLEKEKKMNVQLSRPAERRKTRNEIYHIIDSCSVEQLQKRYSKSRDWKEFVILIKMGYMRRGKDEK